MEKWQFAVLILMFVLSNGTEVYGQYILKAEKTWPWHHRFRVASKNSNWKRVLVGLLAFSLMLFISSNEDFLKSATAHLLQQRHSQFFVAVITLALGTFAFWFKKKNQVNYGLFEIVFGIGCAFCCRFRYSLNLSSRSGTPKILPAGRSRLWFVVEPLQRSMADLSCDFSDRIGVTTLVFLPTSAGAQFIPPRMNSPEDDRKQRGKV
jgi:hypothetical protein